MGYEIWISIRRRGEEEYIFQGMYLMEGGGAIAWVDGRVVTSESKSIIFIKKIGYLGTMTISGIFPSNMSLYQETTERWRGWSGLVRN